MATVLFYRSEERRVGKECFNFIYKKMRQEKIYQHFCSIWQHLAAKCAFRALQRVAYGIDSGAAYCRIQ